MAPFFTKEKIMTVRLGPMLGVHAGPAALAVAYAEKE
jgi:fatty acid-binding protein DegV